MPSHNFPDRLDLTLIVHFLHGINQNHKKEYVYLHNLRKPMYNTGMGLQKKNPVGRPPIPEGQSALITRLWKEGMRPLEIAADERVTVGTTKIYEIIRYRKGAKN
jgi:hypothetical protein